MNNGDTEQVNPASDDVLDILWARVAEWRGQAVSMAAMRSLPIQRKGEGIGACADQLERDIGAIATLLGTEENDDNPFVYGPNEEQPPRPKHPVIGTCASCGGPAYTELHGDVFCFPCAYSEAH